MADIFKVDPDTNIFIPFFSNLGEQSISTGL